jgi:hypothetical protein
MGLLFGHTFQKKGIVIMTCCKWLLIVLVVFGFADFAACEVDESVLLKAQLKLLQSKIDKQARELKALQERVEQLEQTNARLKGLCKKAGIDTKVPEDSTPSTPTDRKTATGSSKPTSTRSVPVSITQVLSYTFQRTAAADKEKMSIGRTKVINDAIAKTQTMLARGPITLTYRVINVNARTEGTVELKLGYPQEVLNACIAAKTLSRKRATSLAMSSYRTISISMSSKQAMAIRKSAKLIYHGKTKLYASQPSRGFPAGSLVIFRQSYGWPSYVKGLIRTHYLVMENSKILLNGQEVERAK